MATGTDAIILAALLDHLGTLVFSPALKIAMPGVNFPTAGQSKPDNYLAVSFLPNRTASMAVGVGPNVHFGLLQVSVLWKSGAGLVKPLDAADRVITHFAKNTVLFSAGRKVKISRKPWAASPLQEDDRVLIPVSIPYESSN